MSSYSMVHYVIIQSPIKGWRLRIRPNSSLKLCAVLRLYFQKASWSYTQKYHAKRANLLLAEEVVELSTKLVEVWKEVGGVVQGHIARLNVVEQGEVVAKTLVHLHVHLLRRE